MTDIIERLRMNVDDKSKDAMQRDGERAADEIERLRTENAALKRDLQYARDGLTKGRTRMREDNERLAREAHTWWTAAQTYAAELERHKPLMQAVEWILEDGHMNQEHLARMRAAWEAC